MENLDQGPLVGAAGRGRLTAVAAAPAGSGSPLASRPARGLASADDGARPLPACPLPALKATMPNDRQR